VEAANNLSQDMTTVYKKNLSDLVDLDFAKAVSDLTQQQAGLDAAQKAYTRVTGLSLFNYL
jgi:flagellar hook-associated protein 3 FlgL